MGARVIDAQNAYGQASMEAGYDHFAGQQAMYATGPYHGGAPYEGGSQMQGLDSVGSLSNRGPDAMGTTRQSGRSDLTSKSYQRYTEKSTGGAGAGSGIDPETGITPRRLTDCVCAVIFVLYVLGMIVMLIVVHSRTANGRPWGNTMRLSRGFDSAGKLCGVDEGVQNASYLFWCRSDAFESEKGNPTGLDLYNPACVSECPIVPANGSVQKKIGCLFQGDTRPVILPGGQFGNEMSFHAQSQQSIMETIPYNTTAFGGRYCLPDNETLKAQILHGPLNWRVRLVHKIGSFEDAWGVLFLASVLAVALGYAYVLLIKEGLAQPVIVGTVVIAMAVSIVCSIFFLLGVFTVTPWVQDAIPWDWYKGLNPIYTRSTLVGATVASGVIGAGLLIVSCCLYGFFTHVKGPQAWSLWDMLKCSAEVVEAMKSIMIPPAIEALWKFILMWILLYNVRILFTVGWVDDHRIVISGEHYKGMSGRFHFDWHILPWIGYYLFGTVWIIELCNAFGHFLISFAVISWYFMRKESGRKTGVPPSPPLHALFDAIVYHAGSICLGAAIVPWTRVVRVFNFLVHESLPDENSGCLGSCCKGLSRCSDCSKNWTFIYKYSKNAYADVIIRSQHFLPAAERSFSILRKYKPCDDNVWKCGIVNVIGVTSIGAVCSFFTYVMIVTIGWYNDPASDSYIDDPLAVVVLAFLLCSNIAYGFMMLFDHTADMLLYCYAHSRSLVRGEVNKHAVEKFVPELLKRIVDHDNKGQDEKMDFKLYGAARPEMYLSTWLPRKKKNIAQDGDTAASKSQMGSQLQTGALDSQGYYQGPPMGSGYHGMAQYSPVPGGSHVYPG